MADKIRMTGFSPSVKGYSVERFRKHFVNVLTAAEINYHIKSLGLKEDAGLPPVPPSVPLAENQIRKTKRRGGK